jgi:hypothetical protein
MDRAEQEQADKAPKPPIHGLPRREVNRKHPPLTPGAHHVTQRVDDLPKVRPRFAPRFAGCANSPASELHSSSVSSLGYRSVFFSMATIRPRVAVFHIHSLNHHQPPTSSYYQTASYSELQFFPKLAAFNIGWHELPRRHISSFAPPRGVLTKPGLPNHGGDHSDQYRGFPPLVPPRDRHSRPSMRGRPMVTVC